jgi:hypothetical protein
MSGGIALGQASPPADDELWSDPGAVGVGLGPGAGAGRGTVGGATGRAGVVVTGVTAWRRGPHETLGSVPRTKAIVTTRTHSFDGSRSIGTRETRSGTGKSSRALSPSTLAM